MPVALKVILVLVQVNSVDDETSVTIGFMMSWVITTVSIDESQLIFSKTVKI